MRPIITDGEGVILGGNMRYKALCRVADMTEAEITSILNGLRSSQHKTEGQRKKLSELWIEWLKAPFAYVVDASALTPEEKEALIIKDNVNLGQWDWDMLDNFDQDDLQEWGLQTWSSLQPLAGPSAPTESTVVPVADNRERIIIIFPRDRRLEMERFLRLRTPSKAVYKISELLNPME